MALLKYLSVLNPLKKKKFSVLPKPDCPLACLMLGSAIVTANSAVCEIFDTIDKYSHTPCDKVTLKTIHGTHQVFTDKEKAKRANEITATIHYYFNQDRRCEQVMS